ncbi:MAG: hypothetical protein R2705_06270 [Ilumatobacteraceae bacterium]
MAARLISLGWCDELPVDEIPNMANLSAGFRGPAWDPDQKFNLPWQSGMTGIGYNIEATGRELKQRFGPVRSGVLRQDLHADRDATRSGC